MSVRFVHKKGKPLIANIRYGFATNSSSTHSIITGPVPKGWKEESGRSGEFGWEQFALVTPDAKSKYFRQAVYGWAIGKVPQDAAVAIAKATFPIGAADDPIDGYIDHQSHPAFPRPMGDIWHGDYEMAPLWRWITTRIITDNNVVILGGNDGAEDADRTPDSMSVPWLRDMPREKEKDFIFKADADDGHITTFDKRTGTKIRSVALDGSIPKQAALPELIDLKITDQCSSNCSWCYQGSSHNGRAADPAQLSNVLHGICWLKPFEVAVGGGDPLGDDDALAAVIETLDHADIIANSSSRRTPESLTKPPVSLLGGLALSTNDKVRAARWLLRSTNADGLAEFRDRFQENPTLKMPKLAIHYILGLEPVKHLRSFLKFLTDLEIYGTVVLLKWKEAGRAGPQPHSSDGWSDIVWRFAQSRGITVAVDSFLADEVADTMPDIPKVLYESGDGHFSMYIDAVELYAAPHSVGGKPKVNLNGTINFAEAWFEIRAAAGK